MRVSAGTVRVDGHVETTNDDVDFGVVIRGIGGSRNTEGAVLDLASTAPGDFTVTLGNLPASWTEGFTCFSVSTSLVRGTGSFFGAELDALVGSSFSQPAGSVFHFLAGGPGYPSVPYQFPASIAQLVQGITFDAVALLYGPGGSLVGVSNVDRVTIQ